MRAQPLPTSLSLSLSPHEHTHTRIMCAAAATTAPSFLPESLLQYHPLLRISLATTSLKWRKLTVPRAVSDHKTVLLDGKSLDSYLSNGNGLPTAYSYDEGSPNDSLKFNTHGSALSNVTASGGLMEYSAENGSASMEDAVVETKQQRQRKVEEIGQEEAWFKRAGTGNLEVAVAPGGRWNRFKTYSTIQRTLGIWGCVFTFLFKAWLNKQKFTYRGNLSEP